MARAKKAGWSFRVFAKGFFTGAPVFARKGLRRGKPWQVLKKCRSAARFAAKGLVSGRPHLPFPPFSPFYSVSTRPPNRVCLLQTQRLGCAEPVFDRLVGGAVGAAQQNGGERK